jgi:hypothetical protein
MRRSHPATNKNSQHIQAEVRPAARRGKMQMAGLKAGLLFTTACASALIVAAPVRAQEAAQIGEVIVTARKRQESILTPPASGRNRSSMCR